MQCEYPVQLNRYNADCFVGGARTANDGSKVIEIGYRDSSSRTYSIVQLVNSSTLHPGDASASSAGNDGSSETTRYHGLGPRMLK